MSQPTFHFDAIAIRQALSDLPLTSAWETLAPPKSSEIYIPERHNKALLQDVSVVEGMRGAGKSFWTAVLADDAARTLVASVANIPQLSSKLIVKIGFGLSLDSEDFPAAKRIESLMRQGCTAEDIWRSVLLRYLLKELEQAMPFDDGVDAAAHWVRLNRDEADRYLTQCDRDLVERDNVLLLLFDSLDRLADDWGHIREILSAALQLGLECRTRRAIRFKFFLRPDMVEEDDEIWRFTDSSKLLHSKEELTWRSNDLFGLILLYLANSPSVGTAFRQEVSGQTHVAWQENNGAYPLPRDLIREQPLRRIVEALAGSWVGNSARRGFTYTWIPTHLSDAKGRLSPRSILLAFKHAAQWTAERHTNHVNALHYEGIQQGVVQASKIRINEIKEDYPWVGPLLKALEGATVPLYFFELEDKWTESCIKASLDAAQDKQRLPPRRYSSDPNRKGDLHALVDDLIELAVLYRTEDRRLNMPDIFRVGFGIKRKGGVRPPR